MRVPVELRQAYKLLNHGPTTLIAATARGRTNVMAAEWVMPLDFDPPKLCAVVGAGGLTRELIDASGEFTVNVPPASMLNTVYGVGKVSGKEVDKFARFKLTTEHSARVGTPLVSGCVAWLECKVEPLNEARQRYDVIFAEVLAAWADDRVFIGGDWHFADPANRTLHHVSRGSFFTTGERLLAEEP